MDLVEFFRFFHPNPSTSYPILTILVLYWLTIIPLEFSYPNKLLCCGFLQFKSQLNVYRQMS